MDVFRIKFSLEPLSLIFYVHYLHARLSCKAIYTVYMSALLVRIVFIDGEIWNSNPSKALLLLRSGTETPETFSLLTLIMFCCMAVVFWTDISSVGIRCFESVLDWFWIMCIFWCISKVLSKFPIRFQDLSIYIYLLVAEIVVDGVSTRRSASQKCWQVWVTTWPVQSNIFFFAQGSCTEWRGVPAVALL